MSERFVLENGKVFKIVEQKTEATQEETIKFLLDRVSKKEKVEKEFDDIFKIFNVYWR